MEEFFFPAEIGYTSIMNKLESVAHITKDGKRHLLRDHLISTADIAKKMASEFNCGDWAYIAGLWHDLGKYSLQFQKYICNACGDEAHLEGKPGKVDHSSSGALYAKECFNQTGHILAYLIAGHHAGLPDWEADTSGRASLSQRLQRTELLENIRNVNIPHDILSLKPPNEHPPRGADPALWIRLLFSCVVDADFLDTEAFFDPDRSDQRSTYPTIANLLPSFREYMKNKLSKVDDTLVNKLRKKILSECLANASGNPGIYTLTVPTGGGKTLSSMAFALNHAIRYNKRRIIYVIPYTSIIEQTADQFRDIFGDAVVEHHSNLDVSDKSLESTRSRLACENWDAPLIITTSVQFFESLFASRTSRCRKLHNIVNSVVILDEVQLLPPDFLKPILHIIDELARNYGLTFLFSTATQPCFEPQPNLQFEGISHSTEIISEQLELHDKMKRVEISIQKDRNIPVTWEDLADKLISHSSVLCIVNRRDDCRILWSKMPKGTYHLSALMCGAHRSQTIRDIKNSLSLGDSTRVISTQLVEAGVDFDFPVVYRALAGLESIAQAAGRCNREGHLKKGKVVVFIPPSTIPAGHLRQAAEIGYRLLMADEKEILSPDRFKMFFEEFYWLQSERLDKHNIMEDLKINDNNFRCSFRTAAQKFRIIDDSQYESVIVQYEDGRKIIELLRRIGPERWLLRKLQRYVVNLPRYIHAKIVKTGGIKELYPGIFIQIHEKLYDVNLGLSMDSSLTYEPDELII